MSDVLGPNNAADSSVRREPRAAFWLPASNRRWIVRYALAMTAVVNLVVSASLAWLTTIGHAHLGLVSVPLIGAPSLVTDTLGTFVILPITTSVLCSLGVRGYRRRGLVDPMRLPDVGLMGWLSRLPSGDVHAGLIMAGWTAALLAPGSCALLIVLCSAGASRSSFVIYKAVLGMALGAVITPLVAMRAMAQGSGPNAPVLT